MGNRLNDCAPPSKPKRVHLPDERKSVTHKFVIHGHSFEGDPKAYDGYLTVGLYPDGSPGEIFVRFSKMGGRQGALLDAWCTSVSVMLQHGIPVDYISDKFLVWTFEPQGFTENDEIKTCKSPLDYIAKWLKLKFGKAE